ncbi:hypothetical protein [Megamonas funiformis]|uniref:hypothetical protein n=1 Tax=Megamonas funiformis TaxID=437897 RepID=UPI003F7F3484
MYTSLPAQDACEFITYPTINPLVSQCQIKVLYVGENRNGTVISKAVAAEMGKKLPGSPIVGYYNKEDQDFEGHNKDIEWNGETYDIIDMTKPYGFIGENAHVWFQKFQDEDGVIRDYLLTEGYIWSGIYPESQRIIDKGNNQSMELDKDTLQGNWGISNQNNGRVFIINDATITKLCILGENFEPCFEGAQITGSAQFGEYSLQNDLSKLREAIAAMSKQIQEYERSSQMEDQVIQEQEQEVIETPEAENFEKIKDNPIQDEQQKSEETVEEPQYSLEEIPEYIQLKADFEQLQNDYSALKEENEALVATNQQLNEFKLSVEKKDKQAMIDSFYMLSAEDKQEVQNNIDNYSLNDIEAKLSIICVRNKVDFSLNDKEDEKEKEAPIIFSLDPTVNNSDIPEWIQAVKENM